MSECPYCTNAFEVNDTCHDEFRMWQGLVGPYYIPTIEDGVLTWTNTGGLPNPNPINIIGAQGNGLYIGGIAETTGDLPETAENGVTWLVGSDEPYEGYVYLNGSWVDIGAVTPGPTGPQGIPGAGVPSGGTTGQVLQKASNTDYQTEWADPESGGDPPGTMLPLMDGTAAVGTARSYAREDHVHPQDSEIAELKTSIIQASGYAVTGNGTSGQLSLTGLTADHVVGNWGMFSDSAYTTPIPENAPTCDLTITTYSGYWTYTVENFTSTFYLKPTFIKD